MKKKRNKIDIVKRKMENPQHVPNEPGLGSLNLPYMAKQMREKRNERGKDTKKY